MSFLRVKSACALIVGFVLVLAVEPGCRPKAGESKFSRDDSLQTRFEKALRLSWPAERDEELDKLCRTAFAVGEEPLSLEIFEKIEGTNARDTAVFGNIETLIARGRFADADAWIDRLSNPTKREIGQRLVRQGMERERPGSGK